MPATLRVDPSAVHAAAAAQSAIAASLADPTAGAALADAAGAMTGFATAEACRSAAGFFTAATATARDGLAAHAGSLDAAATAYHRADAELSRRLGGQ
jgi:hypothetical protein